MVAVIIQAIIMIIVIQPFNHVWNIFYYAKVRKPYETIIILHIINNYLNLVTSGATGSKPGGLSSFSLLRFIYPILEKGGGEG